ncbi:putative lipid II flippase FtsW [Candidatus Gracilibacteria bacterium]|nr:putative lipid II flippase FtsW [Candidatus Gracilibacteria bacterium]
MSKAIDYKLFFTVLALIIFGMIMISSVSVYGSFRVTSAMANAGYIESAYNHFYVIRNIIHVLIAGVVIAIFAKIPFGYYEKYSKQIFSFAIMLLIIVLLIGQSYKGATGWLSIPGIPFTIQPTEFLKFALIIFLAAFFKKHKKYLHTFSDGFLPFALILGVIILLVGAQPDFGTILVVVPLSCMMFFVAGANVRYLVLLTVLGGVLASSIYLAGDYDKETGKNLNTLGYITQRIDNFLADNQEAISNRTINYQTEQALIAIGSGGFTGLGFGQSVQKFGYLPEVQGDFIFSVVVEELGFLGALILLSMYLYIGYLGLRIAKYSMDPFAEYAAFGVTCWIVLQAFINIGVNLNIVPLTGITLPFISYGGSSLLSLSLGLALLLSISREVNQDEYYKKWKRKRGISLPKRIGM